MSTDTPTTEAFLEKIVDMANETPRRLHGSFAQVCTILDEAELIIAVWPAKTEPKRVEQTLIKGMRGLFHTMVSGEAELTLFAAIPCASVEEAEALRSMVAERQRTAA